MVVSLNIETADGNNKEITDFASCLIKFEVTTQRLNAPTKATFSLVETGKVINEGAAVLCKVDGETLFKGFVFKIERTQTNKVTFTCYDQLRYLKAKASYAFEAMSLTDIIKRIAADLSLTVGTLADSEYKFPMLLKENTSCLDIIFEALAETTRQTGKIFTFYDDNGKLTLKESKELIWDAVIMKDSLLSEYTLASSIDSDTYNRIKLVRPNENTGRADTYVAQDSDTINKWGVLQLYKKVDENLNSAQIEQAVTNYLAYYNKVWKTLKLKGIVGYTPFRAGWYVPVNVKDMDANDRLRILLAEKVTHRLEGDSHFMDIETKNL